MMPTLDIFGIPMPWDAPEAIATGIFEIVGIFIVGIIILVIGILLLTNRINVGSPYIKWPVGIGMLVVGGYLLLGVI